MEAAVIPSRASLCLYPLSDEFDQARWSQRTFLLSLSDGMATELRERSLRQASPSADRADITQVALPWALVAVSRWDSIP